MEKEKLNLDSCLKCSYCNTVCPLVKACPEYPGPKKLGSDMERFRREGIDCSLDWADYCLGCGQCDLICPNQVHVAEYIAEAKKRQKKSGMKKLRDYMLARPAMLGTMSTVAASFSNFAIKAATPLMPLAGISAKRRMPKYSSKVINGSDMQSKENQSKEPILFFPGCFTLYNRPEIGIASVKALEMAGYAVKIAETGCCGLPALGEAEKAKEDARKNIEAMEEAIRQGWKIVASCTSCGHTLKAKYVGLVKDDAQLVEMARQLAANTYDLGELLLEADQAGALIHHEQEGNSLKLAYHAPCHLKAQGIGTPWLQLLQNVFNINILDVDSGCCGMSGTYGFKKEKYDISMKIGQPLFQRLAECNPGKVISECATCRLQIEQGSGYQAVHPVEIFAENYFQ